MRRVAIVSPVRTAVGNFGGALKDIPAEELASTVIKELEHIHSHPLFFHDKKNRTRTSECLQQEPLKCCQTCFQHEVWHGYDDTK